MISTNTHYWLEFEAVIYPPGDDALLPSRVQLSGPNPSSMRFTVLDVLGQAIGADEAFRIPPERIAPVLRDRFVFIADKHAAGEPLNEFMLNAVNCNVHGPVIALKLEHWLAAGGDE